MKTIANELFSGKLLRRLGIALVIAVAALLGIALLLVLIPPRGVAGAKLTYDFASVATTTEPDQPPAPQFYRARDGTELAYRFYDSTAERILIFVHGSSYHGGGYVALAKELSSRGIAKVYLPNLRGHYLSGSTRGDVRYVGQLEDDIADLIAFARVRGQNGPIILGGHSSGGGFAIRFAGGPNGPLVSGYVLLTPVLLPPAPTYRATAGWATADVRRIIGLRVLNAFHIHTFDGLPVIWFNKPEQYRDGTETLSYSYRLNQSMHPRFNYGGDIAAMGKNVLVVVGSEDEQNDAHAYGPLFANFDLAAKVVILPGVRHLEIIRDPAMMSVVGLWLASLR